jgi:hypothetical protein
VKWKFSTSARGRGGIVSIGVTNAKLGLDYPNIATNRVGTALASGRWWQRLSLADLLA